MLEEEMRKDDSEADRLERRDLRLQKEEPVREEVVNTPRASKATSSRDVPPEDAVGEEDGEDDYEGVHELVESESEDEDPPMPRSKEWGKAKREDAKDSEEETTPPKQRRARMNEKCTKSQTC